MQFQLTKLLSDYIQKESVAQDTSAGAVPLVSSPKETIEFHVQTQNSKKGVDTRLEMITQVATASPFPNLEASATKLLSDFDEFEREKKGEGVRLRSISADSQIAQHILFSPRTSTMQGMLDDYHNQHDAIYYQTNKMPLKAAPSSIKEKQFYRSKLWSNTHDDALLDGPRDYELPVPNKKHCVTHHRYAPPPSFMAESYPHYNYSTAKQEKNVKSKQDCCIFHSDALVGKFSLHSDGMGDEMTIKHFIETYQKQKLRAQRRRRSSTSSQSALLFDPQSPAYSPSLGPWSIDRIALPEPQLLCPSSSEFLSCYQECSA